MFQHLRTATASLTNFDDFVNTGVCIDVDVADPLAVTQHRDALGSPLDVPHQLRRAPRDYQVDHLVQSAEVLHLLSCAHLVTQKHMPSLRHGNPILQVHNAMESMVWHVLRFFKI